MRKKITRYAISAIAPLILPFCKKGIEASLKERWVNFGIEASNICNANCSFCGYGKGMDKRKKGFVDFRVLKHTLELYHKAGGGVFSFGSILGDPLADKEFLKKVKFVRGYPSITNMNIFTNLIGLDNFNVEDFVKSGLTNVAISTAIGDSQTYKRLFGVDRYYKTMKNTLDLLRTNKRLGSPLKIMIRLRCDYNILKELRYNKEFAQIRQYVNEDDITTIDKDKWDDYNGVVKKIDLPEDGGFKTIPKDNSAPCYGLYRKIQVLKNGDISVCSCRFSPELVVDNIFNYNSLYDYWKGKKLNLFRKKWQDGDIPSICKGCTHYIPYTGLMTKLIKGKIKHIFKSFFRWLRGE